MIRRALRVYVSSFSGLSRTVWLLGLVTLINRTGTMVIPFLTVYLITQLHFTLSQAGLVMTFFGIGSFIGTFLGGHFTDRIGSYPIQFWSLLLSGMLFFMLLFLHTVPEWCIGILIHATISDAFRPAMMASIASYSKPENRTRSVSLIRLAINAGWALGPAIGGLLAATIGYHWLFIVDGSTCIAAAIFFRLVIKPPPAVAPSIPAAIVDQTIAATSAKNSVYRDYRFLLFISLNTIGAIAFFQFLSTQPVYYKQHLMLNEAHIGGIMALNGLLIAFLEMPIVYVFERRFKILPTITVGCILIGISYFMYNLTTWAGIAILATIVVTFGEIFTMPFANAYALARANDSNRGRYMAVYGISYSLAFTGAPAIGAFIADHHGFTALWYAIGSISLVAALGFWLMRRLAP